jgi:hypothetical protein
MPHQARASHDAGRVRPERDQHESQNATILLSFESTGWTIAFTRCPEVVEGLNAILHGWGVRRITSPGQRKIDAYVTKTTSGYRWRAESMTKPKPWSKRAPVSTMEAVWDLHDVFFDWWLEKNPRHLCIHGAAVRMGKGLVCFPSVTRAGKSTLCVELVSSGRMLYCDDVLPIEPRSNFGMSMGIAPILRKPLPRDIGSAFIDFVTARRGPSNKDWTYVILGRGEIAPFGDVAPIKALVLLRRDNQTGAHLETVPRNEMLREIILQNFASTVPPVQILDRLLHIAERVGCYRLRYGRIASAAQLLEDKFGRGFATK